MHRDEVIANSTTAAKQIPLWHKEVDPEATGPWLSSGQNTTITPALASGQIPKTKPMRGWKKPTVEKISKAKSDLEELYARVSPLLRRHPARAKYFSDELWRILEVLGRLKMTLSSPDLPESTLTIRSSARRIRVSSGTGDAWGWERCSRSSQRLPRRAVVPESFFMIRFSCPKCQMVQQAAAEQAGATVACPRCKFQMRVGSAALVAKVASQPDGPTLDPQSDLRADQRADQRSPAAAPTSTAPTTALWYFTREGERYGPYATAQVKQFAGSGQLLSTDLVWEEGMDDWKRAFAAKRLFPAQQPPSQPAAQALTSG
jgi:hypothetical protein